MLAADAGADVDITNSIFWNFSFSDNVRATIIIIIIIIIYLD